LVIGFSMKLLTLALLTVPAAPQDSRIRAPEGYEVERVAGPPLVERPIMAGFDDQGRLYVSDSAGVNLRFPQLSEAAPHRIVRLEDTDGDGRFDRSVVFADRMTFPMGALWYRGALYVCSPPSLWRLRDTDGDGKADERVELVGRFGSTGNAADIHGPFLHPSGWIWWTDGRHGHSIRRSDGTAMEGKAARIFRARPDGTGVEVVCGGGMDNPVEIAFTEEGEGLATVALLHAQPRRVDGIIHCIEGGVFPYHEVVREFKKTGDLLPAVADLGWVAPSGLVRSGTGEWYVAHFNTRAVRRVVVERDGATFRGFAQDFLVSDDPDFHPTDVLEDAQGDLLVLDTGGWFRIGCPTSRVEKPEVKGAIYRVRRKGAARRPLPADPREGLDDSNPVRAEAAVEAWARRGEVAPLERILAEGVSPRARRNAVWALTRIDGPAARAAVRRALADPDPSVRMAACQSAGLYGDRAAVSALRERLREGPAPVAREAATALGRIGDPEALGELFAVLSRDPDRFLEHAALYAAIRMADPEGTRRRLRHEDPRIRRGALIVLDQMEGGGLSAGEAAALLDPAHPRLLEAAIGVLSARGWAKEAGDWIDRWLSEATPRSGLETLLSGFARDAGVQDRVARALREEKTTLEMCLFLLEFMARAPVDRPPPAWVAELGRALGHADARVARQAILGVRALKVTELDGALLEVARDAARPDEVRAEAFAAAAPRARVDAALFEFLRGCLAPERPVLLREAAAQGLGSALLAEGQIAALAPALERAGPLELPKLVGAWERARTPEAGRALLEALSRAASLESLPAEALRGALRHQPEEIRAAAGALLGRLEADAAAMKARLAELEDVLSGGDPGRGREVFFGPRGACSSCHAVAGQGARIGPDLAGIGAIRTRRDLLEAVVFPSAGFARGYEPWRLKTRDGEVIDGLRVRESADAITILQADRTERRVRRAAIEDIREGRTSVMPAGLDRQLAREELRDLLAFLASLR
jgi:putative heme-binding domain-containing protein